MPHSFQENSQKEIKIQYFAVLREQRGLSDETLETSAETPEQLYHHLRKTYGFHLATEQLQVAINNEFCTMDSLLKNNDHVVFIPPVAGG